MRRNSNTRPYFMSEISEIKIYIYQLLADKITVPR